jgi:hypothetical protein
VEIVVDLSDFGGQTVTLQLRVEADSSLESNLYLDDFSFEASVSGDGGTHSQAFRMAPGR